MDHRAMDQADPIFVAIAKALYGEAVDPQELWKSMPDQSTLHVQGDQNKNKNRKRIGIGLAAGTAAESLGAAHSIRDAIHAYKDPHIPKLPKLQRGMGLKAGLKALGHDKSKGMAVADAAVQSTNFLVGGIAAKELLKPKKPKVAKPVKPTVSKHFGPSRKVMRARIASNMAAAAKGRRNIFLGGVAAAGTAGGFAGYKIGQRKTLKRLAPAPPAAEDTPRALGPAEPAVNEPKKLTKSAEFTWTGEISKVDTDKRLVFGFCSLSKVNGEPIVDLQGDFIPIEETETSAYRYVIESRKGGDMHRRVQKIGADEPLHTADLVESMVFTPEKLEKLGLPADSVPHGWWIGMKVNDDEQWANVKNGKRLGFSLHGRGRRVEKALD